MGLSPWESSESQLFALVTGANSGLGFGIATRMIDEFFTSPSTPSTKHLVLILCTRSPAKSHDTISRLRARLQKFAKRSSYAKNARTKAQAAGNVYKWEDTVQRVHFIGVLADLCDLKSVYALADRLVNGTVGSQDTTDIDGQQEALSHKEGLKATQKSRECGLSGVQIPRLDVVILNAGMGGWIDLHWFRAVWGIMTNLIEETTWPTFKIPNVGAVAKPQLTSSKPEDQANGAAQPLLSSQEKFSEPPLGEVFCSNTFGHYILCHELMPLLSMSSSSSSSFGGKIIWISSTEGLPNHLSIDDIQGLQSQTPYEGTKRLTDILALTANLPSVQRISASFFDAGSDSKTSSTEQSSKSQHFRPRLFSTHPGIFASEIFPLHFILAFFMKLTILFARWLGSPWHPISPYKAATAPVWVALTPDEVLEDMGGNKVKWGSATNRMGQERVKMTEVSGWGWDGNIESASGEKICGRRRDAVDLMKEDREEFEVLGGKCWQKMEELRKEWEGVLGVKKNQAGLSAGHLRRYLL